MRQENVNRFFKTWKILKDIYRHDRSTHCSVFWSVAIMTQLSFDLDGKTNYQVEYIGETYEEARKYLGNFI
jgi:hypothetical protein